MTTTIVTRRNLLATGTCALFAAASLARPMGARASEDHNSATEDIVRKWYAAWVNKDYATFNALLADDFTFSSAAGDDHISKSTFKTQCWDTQIGFIKAFEIERMSSSPNDAFVKYLCHTVNGKSFRNVEYLRLKDGQFKSIECYFGAESSFPSAVSNKK